MGSRGGSGGRGVGWVVMDVPDSKCERLSAALRPASLLVACRGG